MTTGSFHLKDASFSRSFDNQITISPLFEADIAFIKSFKDVLTAKLAADRQYAAQLDTIVRSSRKNAASLGPSSETLNMLMRFQDDIASTCAAANENVLAVERLLKELQAIMNIRENQKKMLEVEYIAIVKGVQKESKRIADLKKDFFRLYEACVNGLNGLEKSKQKGNSCKKEKSLLEHNLVRLLETHNLCYLASVDLKNAQILANTVHLPSLRRFMEKASKHFLFAIISIFVSHSELLQSFGQTVVDNAKETQKWLENIRPEDNVTVEIDCLRLNDVTEDNVSEVSLMAVNCLAKNDPRLKDFSQENYCLFAESESALDEILMRFQNELSGQILKQQRLEANISDQKQRLSEYLNSEDNSISGRFARECEIAKLESEFSGTEAVKEAISNKQTDIESLKPPASQPLPSLVGRVTAIFGEMLAANTEDLTATTSNRLPGQARASTASSIETMPDTPVEKTSIKKAKFHGFFKSVKRNFASKIRHETIRDDTDDENDARSPGNSRRPSPGNHYTARIESSEDNDSESSNASSGDGTPFWTLQVRDLLCFHGILPRTDINRLFQLNGCRNGDFLLRESFLDKDNEKIEKVLILSVYWEQPRHFRLASQSCPQTSWRLTGPRDFGSIAELIRYHVESGDKVTENKDVRLFRALNRTADFLQNEWVVLGRVLGQGAYGAVYTAIFHPPSAESSTDVAVKVLKPQLSTMNKEEKAALINEARQMQSLAHPHIVRFIGIAASQEPVMIVMELCLGGSLLAHLRRQGTRMTLSEMYRFSFEAASGMEYLSKMRVIHRDLAARNCLITKEKSLKISDFGLSRKSPNNSTTDNIDDQPVYQPVTPVKIPIRWTAPETFFRNVYTTSTDVWSYGILLSEIFDAGAMPWAQCKSNNQARDAIQSGECHPRPKRMPCVFYDSVMAKCLEFHADSRFSFSAIKNLTERFVQSSDLYNKPPTVNEDGYVAPASRPQQK